MTLRISRPSSTSVSSKRLWIDFLWVFFLKISTNTGVWKKHYKKNKQEKKNNDMYCIYLMRRGERSCHLRLLVCTVKKKNTFWYCIAETMLWNKWRLFLTFKDIYFFAIASVCTGGKKIPEEDVGLTRLIVYFSHYNVCF